MLLMTVNMQRMHMWQMLMHMPSMSMVDKHFVLSTSATQMSQILTVPTPAFLLLTTTCSIRSPLNLSRLNFALGLSTHIA
jgi:hypothetical protein